MESTKVGTVEQLRFSRRPCRRKRGMRRRKRGRGALVWRTARLCSEEAGTVG